MSQQFAGRLLLMLVLLLLLGTQMPGAWRAGVVNSLHAPAVVSSVAHFVLFCAMALLAHVRPLAWPWVRVVLLSLALALITEGLQVFAIDRHPRWLDVGIDMAGAFLGVSLSGLGARLQHGSQGCDKTALYCASRSKRLGAGAHTGAQLKTVSYPHKK